MPVVSVITLSIVFTRVRAYMYCVYQVEDERFEVDMVIDANMCTIRVLEPLAEEIATMKAVEAMPRGPGACLT
jgi:histone deacetylase complex regulatory component SIN3